MKTKSIILKELVKIARLCGEKGLVTAKGGNISAKVGDTIYIKKEGASLGEATIKDFIPIKINKESEISSLSPKPSTEFRMHIACFKERPDIGAVIHTHPVFSTVLANTGVSPHGLTYSLAATMNSEVPHLKFIKPGSAALAIEVGKKIKNANGLLLSNHGIVAVGKDLKQAFERSLALERASKVYVLTKLLH